MSAYTVIWKTNAWAYGPKGGDTGVSCSPRTSVPEKATRVPAVWSMPPRETSAVRLIVFAKSAGLNAKGGGRGAGGEGGSAGLAGGGISGG